MLKPLLIIQLGQPPQAVLDQVGQQSDWFISALSLMKSDIKIIRPDLHEDLPTPESVCAAIITGSWSMVTDLHPWSEVTAEWIRAAHQDGLPLLGVCYGHQLIAHALGGRVGDNPAGVERGIQLIEVHDEGQNDPLLKQIPKYISAWLTHQQTVLTPPKGAQVLAFSTQDRCQMIRYSDTTFSLQFHPEFTLDIMLTCLRNNKTPELLPAEINLPTWPKIILQRFYDYYCRPATSC